jgi:hypothetical protein
VAVPVAKNARRAHFVRCKEVAEVVLIHGLREVGNVEVGVLFIGKRLELRVEGFLMKVVSDGAKYAMGRALTLAKLTSYPR